MLRAWRAWRGRVKLFAPAWRPFGTLSTTLNLDFLGPAVEGDGPALAPYDGLADVWDDIAALGSWDYPPFLAALARNRGLAVGAALDLACGTGRLAARLAELAPCVVGLDASDRMLDRARERCAGIDVPPRCRSVRSVAGTHAVRRLRR